MKTWKQIEASRERRLWIKEIVTPFLMGAAIVAYAYKDQIGAKAKKFGKKFKKKKDRFVGHFKKKKEQKESENVDKNTYDATL